MEGNSRRNPSEKTNLTIRCYWTMNISISKNAKLICYLLIVPTADTTGFYHHFLHSQKNSVTSHRTLIVLFGAHWLVCLSAGLRHDTIVATCLKILLAFFIDFCLPSKLANFGGSKNLRNSFISIMLWILNVCAYSCAILLATECPCLDYRNWNSVRWG